MPLSTPTQAPAAGNGITTVVGNPASSGSNTLLAAQGAGVRIRVVSIVAVAAAAVTAEFKSGTTAVSADFPLGANGGFVLGHNDLGWFETAANEALNVDLGSAVGVAMQINCVLI